MYHLRFQIADAAFVLCKFNFSLHLQYDSSQKMERENQLHVIGRFRNTNIWMFLKFLIFQFSDIFHL